MFGGDEAMSSEFIDAVNAVLSTKRIPLRKTHSERFEWRTMEINQLKEGDLEKMRNDPIQAFVNAAMVLDPTNLQAQTYRSKLIDASKEKIEQIRKVQENLEIWLSELVQNALDLNAEEMGLVFDSSTGRMIWWHNGLDHTNAGGVASLGRCGEPCMGAAGDLPAEHGAGRDPPGCGAPELQAPH